MNKVSDWIWLCTALLVSAMSASLASSGYPGLAALAAVVYSAVHVAFSAGPGSELSVLALAGLAGWLATAALVGAGWIAFPFSGMKLGPVPLWIAMLWLVVGAFAHGHLQSLRHRLFSSAALGAGAGLAIHRASEAFGTVALREPAWLAIAAIWAAVVPLLLTASSVVDNADPGFGPAKIMRRLLTIPAEVIGFVFVAILFPILLLATALIDAARWVRGRRLGAVRFLIWLWVYLAAGLLGLIGLFLVWVFGGGDRGNLQSRFIRWSHWVEQTWQLALFDFMRWLFALRLTVEELPGDPGNGTCDIWREKPAIIFMRHASLMDTLLPATLFTRPHEIDLRYVFKWELLADPAIDVAGNRLPNVFVARRGQRTGRDLEALKHLAQDIGPRDWVLIYPEGTRYTPARHDRILEKLKTENPELAALAAGFTHVLPPRPGGPQALLDAAPEADVIFVVHAGLDRAPGVLDSWAGNLTGCHIQVRIWRVCRERIPADHAERTRWLYDEWARVNAWVRQHTEKT